MRFPATAPPSAPERAAPRAGAAKRRLSVAHLVMPLFVREGTRLRKPIARCPGNSSFPSMNRQGSRASLRSSACRRWSCSAFRTRKMRRRPARTTPNGIVPKAVRALKKELPDLIVIADVCLCEYMSHGHCGIVRKRSTGRRNCLPSSACQLIASTTTPRWICSPNPRWPTPKPGADIVAPSDMMDGRVAAIRAALDETGFSEHADHELRREVRFLVLRPVPRSRGIAAAVRRSPDLSDGLAPTPEEALREVALDIEEGADIVMVKPALAYLDLIWRVKEKFGYPVAAYNVSGEYAMVKAAAQNGWLDEKQIVLEIITGLRTAPAPTSSSPIGQKISLAG